MRILIRRDPDTFVGADIVYITPEQAARTPEDVTYLDEPSALVAEVFSPSDTVERLNEKVRDYLLIAAQRS